MPAHVLDSRGTGKAEKRTSLAKTEASTCVTCPNGLSPSDQRNGTRRCKACRTLDPGRKIRVQQSPTFKTDAETCLTCKNALLRKERQQGVRRCAECRSSEPGRPALRRYEDRQPPKLTSRHKLPDIGSWWMNKTREELNATAATRFFVSPPRLVLDHGALNGE